MNMKKIKFTYGILLFMLAIFTGCNEDSYEFGDLTAPANLVIDVNIIGSDTNPLGDGSGEVIVTVSADNAITYHIGFNKVNDQGVIGTVNYKVLASGTTEHKFTDPGTNSYRISVIAFGPGGTASNLTKDIVVKSDYVPDTAVVTAITNDNSKTWVVNKDVPGHFGVDDWTKTEYTETTWWWAAGVDEKLNCCSCFYSTTFTFQKNTDGTFKLTVDAPEGAFTKTGSLANIPNIPETGDEGCYSEYTGGISNFNFIPSSSPISEATSTKIAIKLETNDAFIGYGAVQSEYEILEATSDKLYLRVQGTETGNSWYLILKPVP